MAPRDSDALMGLCGLIKRDFLADVGLTRIVGIVISREHAIHPPPPQFGNALQSHDPRAGEDKETELHSVGRASGVE